MNDAQPGKQIHFAHFRLRHDDHSAWPGAIYLPMREFTAGDGIEEDAGSAQEKAD